MVGDGVCESALAEDEGPLNFATMFGDGVLYGGYCLLLLFFGYRDVEDLHRFIQGGFVGQLCFLLWSDAASRGLYAKQE